MCYFAHQMLKMYLSRLSFARLLGTAINGTTVLIPLIMTFIYYQQSDMSLSAIITMSTFYFFLTIGAILSWGMPYFFDSSQKHKLQFSKFKNTDHFLPARGDNVIPNTLHVVLHLQVWTYLVISIYFLTLVKC
jgi:hypothetical protein